MRECTAGETRSFDEMFTPVIRGRCFGSYAFNVSLEHMTNNTANKSHISMSKTCLSWILFHNRLNITHLWDLLRGFYDCFSYLLVSTVLV